MGPGYPGWPPPPEPRHASPRRPESAVWTPRLLLQRVHHRLLGGGYVWTRGGWSIWTSPCGWGGPRVVGVATGVAGEEMGGDAPPPPEMGVKMYELAQLNLFIPKRKKGGRPTGNSSPTAGKGWAWLGWSMEQGPGPGRRPGRH